MSKSDVQVLCRLMSRMARWTRRLTVAETLGHNGLQSPVVPLQHSEKLFVSSQPIVAQSHSLFPTLRLPGNRSCPISSFVAQLGYVVNESVQAPQKKFIGNTLGCVGGHAAADTRHARAWAEGARAPSTDAVCGTATSLEAVCGMETGGPQL